MSAITSLTAEFMAKKEDSQMSKICIVTLSKEVNRHNQLIEDAILEAYEQNGQSIDMIKPFFKAGLLRGLSSVKLGFSLYPKIL